jgi:chaperone modulatory protein CbpM
VNDRRPLTGVILDEQLTLTLDEVCETWDIQESVVIEMIEEGVAEPLESESSGLEFSGLAVTRLLTAYRLQRDLDINLAGAALVLDLLDEIRRLRGGRRS